MALRIALLRWERARAEAAPIRFKVFVEEQRVPLEIEVDAHDATSIHALAYAEDGGAIGTGRLLPDGHIGRMAVRKEWRGRGVGAAILGALIAEARRLGHAEVALSAQTHALEFYRRFGFVAEGEVYDDAGIPHQAMRKRLRDAAA